MTKKIIRIAENFSRYPAGRYKDDGPYSGERFREELLLPALNKEEPTIIDLDGARGYGSSFLEEAFGGLVRAGYTADLIKKVFELRSQDSSLIDEIIDYIDHGSMGD